jgi:folate-binding protein YgfZ
MSDNPSPAPSAFFALPDHRLLMLGGRDCVDFAQAQFMNDVAALTPGHWQWNGWLTPKGRLIALFALALLDGESACLVLPDADPAQLAAQLQRYVFRSRVTLTVPGDLIVSGAFEPAPATGNAIATTASDEFTLDFSSDASPRTLRIGRASPPTDPAACIRWKSIDLASGLPRLAESQSGQWTPQQLSLDRLRAYSVKKGCYPGQEIVARTHFLGQAKRGLVLFDADGPVAEGTEVVAAGQSIGTIVSSASTPAGVQMLAVLPLSRNDGVLTAGGTVLRERPLSEGLSR